MSGNYKEINDSDLSLSLRKASRIISKIYNAWMRESGAEINSTQFNTLLALSYSEGKNITAVANELCIERSTLSRNLTTLEREGLVKHTKNHPNDRNKFYSLTNHAEDTIKKCIPFFDNAKNYYDSDSSSIKLLEALKNFLAAHSD